MFTREVFRQDVFCVPAVIDHEEAGSMQLTLRDADCDTAKRLNGVRGSRRVKPILHGCIEASAAEQAAYDNGFLNPRTTANDDTAPHSPFLNGVRSLR
jgi:hypothetical protein